MFPSVNGSSAFQTNLYCMERKKAGLAESRRREFGMGVRKDRYCPIRWFMQRGMHSFLMKIHLYGSHAVYFQEGCGYAAGMLLYVTSRKYMVLRNGIFTVERRWGVKWKAAWYYSFPAMQMAFQQRYCGIRRMKKVTGMKEKKMPVSRIHFFFSFCKFF